MPRGIVKYVNRNKGYAFIKPDAGGPDIFAHVQNLKGGLSVLPKDVRVRYEIGNREDGRPQAINIKVIE